jgi:hypothetical protein
MYFDVKTDLLNIWLYLHCQISYLILFYCVGGICVYIDYMCIYWCGSEAIFVCGDFLRLECASDVEPVAFICTV